MEMKAHNRLSVRIIVLIFITVFLPSSLTAVYYKNRLDEDLKKEILSKTASELQIRTDKALSAIKFMAAKVEEIVDHITVRLSGRPDQAKTITGGVPSPGFYESPLYHELAADFRIEISQNERYLQLRLINTTGREIVRLERTDGGVAEIPPNMLQDKSERYYFKHIMESEKTSVHVTRPSLNREFGEITSPHTLIFRISRKVFLDSGEMLGMVVLNVDANMLFGSKLSDGKSGFLIIDEEGTYLHHWDEKLLFEKDLGHGANLLEEKPELRDNLRTQDSRIHYDPELEEYRVWSKVFYNLHNRKHYLVFMKRIPESLVVEPWASTLEKGIYAISLIAVASFLFIFLVVNRSLRPLVELISSIRRLEEGYLGARAGIRSKTEIGKIGGAFDHMARSLENKAKLVKLLKDITVAANGSSTFDEVMLTCLNKVCAYTGWEVGHVYLPDSEGVCVPTELWHIEKPHLFKTFIDVTREITFAPGGRRPAGACLQKRKAGLDH